MELVAPTAASCPWADFAPGTIRFCEDRVCGWVTEPANAWSNVAFFVMGFYLLARAAKQKRAPLYLVGATSLLVGIGSFLFHTSGTFIGEFLDLSAMYFISALMLTMEARRIWTMTLPKLVICFALLSGGSMALVLLFHKIGIVVFGVQVALVYAVNIGWKFRRTASVDHRYAFWLGGTFAGALGIWSLDLTGVMCEPKNHFFNGHSAWHVLTALCLYFFYRHHEQFVAPRSAADVAQPDGAWVLLR